MRIRIDGETLQLEDEIKLDKNKKHSIELVIDRLVVRPTIQSRLADSLALALKWGKSIALVDMGDKQLLFSEKLACANCNVSFQEISPRIFLSTARTEPVLIAMVWVRLLRSIRRLVVPDPKKTLREGAVYPWSKTSNPYYEQILESVAKHFKFSMTTPFSDLSKAHQEVILYGTGEERIKLKHDSYDAKEVWEYKKPFEGIINNLKRRHQESQSDRVRQEIENYMTQLPCTKCDGARLRKESLSVKVGGLSIATVCRLSVAKAIVFFSELPEKMSDRNRTIAHQVLIEIGSRLKFLSNVGLDYLTLERQANTLSGGEAQRIRLATQIGSGLSGVLYVLDEPSVGLHQRDNNRLITTLQHLRDLGNTLACSRA